MKHLESGMMDDRKRFICLRNMLGVLSVGPIEGHAQNFKKLRDEYEICCEIVRPAEYELSMLLYVAQILTFGRYCKDCKALVELAWDVLRVSYFPEFTGSPSGVDAVAYGLCGLAKQIDPMNADDYWWNKGAME